MDRLKLIFGLLISIIGALPIALFSLLLFMTKIEWFMMIRKLPEYFIYIIAGSIFICCAYMIYVGIRCFYKAIIHSGSHLL